MILIFSFLSHSLARWPPLSTLWKFKHSPSVLHVVFIHLKSKSTRTFLASIFPRTPHIELNFEFFLSLQVVAILDRTKSWKLFCSTRVLFSPHYIVEKWVKIPQFFDFFSLHHFFTVWHVILFRIQIQSMKKSSDRIKTQARNIESRLKFNFQHFRILINFHFIIIYFPLSYILHSSFSFPYILSPVQLIFSFFFIFHYIFSHFLLRDPLFLWIYDIFSLFHSLPTTDHD